MSLIPTQPSYSNRSLGMGANAYILNMTGLGLLAHELSSSGFVDGVKKLFSSPADNIFSVRMYPIDLKTYFEVNYNVTNLKIGDYSATTQGYKISANNDFDLLTFGQITIPEFYGHNNFLNYEPYSQYQIYLPFVGFVDLNAREVVGKMLRIRYAVDFLTGDCIAYLIIVSDDQEGEIIIASYPGKLGIDVQLSGNDSAQKVKDYFNLFSSAISTGLGVVAGGKSSLPIAMLGVSNSAMNAFQEKTFRSGQNSPTCSLYSPLECYVIIQRQITANITNFGKYTGFLVRQEKAFNTLTGYTIVDSVHIEGNDFETASTTERQEIERLLKSGVIF